MPFEYAGVEDAVKRSGLRMVVVGAVRLSYGDAALQAWTGGRRNGPIVFYETEKTRSTRFGSSIAT